MAQNHPDDPFQRRDIIDRTSSSYNIHSQLIGAIHGYMSEGKDKPATLLVLSFRFAPQRKNVRIKSVDITVEIYGDNGYPTISAIGPDGAGAILGNVTEQTADASGGVGVRLGLEFGRLFSTERKSWFVFTGLKSPGRKAVGAPNVANWSIMQDANVKAGVPLYLQTAILLERRTDEIFKANINANADVSGLSFEYAPGLGLESGDDPVIFDPGASPLISIDLTAVDSDNLGSVDLSQLYRVQNTIPMDDLPRRRTIGQAVNQVLLEERAAETKPMKYKVESWFIDLWDNGQIVDARPKLDRSLGRDDLNEYFSWISETPTLDQSAPDSQESPDVQQVQQQSRKTHFCNLVAIQSSASKLTTFAKLKGLFDKLPFELLSDFFDLPPDYLISRHHDRGACQVFNSQDDGKTLKLYIIQTPFYSTGFWSLLLYTLVDSNQAGGSIKLSGVIQVDADVKLTDIFRDVRKLVEAHGHHHALLPLQLFASHYEATKEAIDSIQKDVSEVDDKLFEHLKEEGNLDHASKLYRKLSMILHKCSMNLVELGRRRKFEEELGSCLLKDLKKDSKLRVLVEIYSRMSQSRDLDIESLPGKIESQRNVLYNLITQHDSYLQARLARESLRDSKAMKTLSVLTIIFLPGAFIATMFSTNMFDFESKNQQVRIYFAIVIPLTSLLMICWVLWLKNTPERADEESVRQNQPAAAMNWLKGGKAD